MNNIVYLLYASFMLYILSLLFVLVKRNRISLAALACGFVIHTIFLVARAVSGDVFIPGAIFQGVFLLPWSMAVCVILIMYFRSLERPSESGIIFVILFTGLSMLYPLGIVTPMPNKITAWAYSFFFTEVCAQACFLLGGWFAIKCLLEGDGQDIVRRLLSWGFVLYTVAQITGAIWAFLGWGTTFRWSTKHLQSAVIWIYYANYLHMRYMPDRSDKQQQWYAVAGSLLVAYCIFNYYFNEMTFARIGG